jgi:hypothetical protein
MSWQRVAFEPCGPIKAVTRGADGAWVLAGGDSDTHVLFVPVAGEPQRRHRVRRHLTRVRAYDDGTVYAVGPGRVLVGHDGGWVDDEIPALTVTDIWCADHIYVLAEHELLYFDVRWHTVHLFDAGLDGDWAAGDGVGADNVIVGIRGTHSCMARGSAANWTRDGSGSWYHYHVRVGPTRAFATGGDGLWRREAGSWAEHGPYNDRRHYLRTPIALDLVGDTPFVIAALALESPRLRLATFDGAWRVFAWPSAAHVGGVVACRMPDGSILAGDDLGALWRLPTT